jgi:hypothetical protein
MNMEGTNQKSINFCVADTRDSFPVYQYDFPPPPVREEQTRNKNEY